MKNIRDFMRHIRDGFRNLFRNGWLSTASILTMTLTLFTIGFLILFMANVNQVVQDIEEGVRVRVYIDIAAQPEDEQELKGKLEQIQHINGISYRTKDQELEDLKANYGSEFELYEGDANPLRNVFLVNVEDPEYIQDVSQAITKLPYVAEVNYGAIDTENLLKFIEIARVVMALIAAILVVVAIVMVSNTIKMTINARRTEIEIMRLVGAKNSYVRSPFAYEGMFIGLISAFLSSAILYLIYQGIQVASLDILGIKIIKFVPTLPILIYITLALFVFGVILGVYGARRSIKQYLAL